MKDTIVESSVSCETCKFEKTWHNEKPCNNCDGFEKWTSKKEVKDTIVESVINQFKQRSEVGIKKYGVTLDREDLSLLEWLEHTKQEQMDSVLYLERAIKELKNEK